MKKIKLNKRLNKKTKDKLLFWLNGRFTSGYIANECNKWRKYLQESGYWKKIDYSIRYYLTYYASFINHGKTNETFIFEDTAYEKLRNKQKG